MGSQYPNRADAVPQTEALTPYDEEHLPLYLRLLDAEADGADWREVAKIVLEIDPKVDPDRAKAAWESHLARAKWMIDRGYRKLLPPQP